MAIAFDAASSGTPGSGFGLSHTCTGTDRYLTVGVYLQGPSSVITSVTYAGVNMTQLGAVNISATRILRLYGLANPASGANDIVGTYTGSNLNPGIGGMSFTDVHQTTSTGTAATAGPTTSTTPSVVVTSATGEMVVDVVGRSLDTAMTPGSGQTERYDQTVGNGGNGRVAGSHEAGAASVTMAWTITSDLWGIIGISLKPVATGQPITMVI